jgi:conjugal transfer pilus assembly protein TraE
MLWDKYKFKLDKYIYENWTFRIVTLILSGVIVYEGILISEKVNNQRVVVLPPKVSKPFWVSGNLVSKSYLEQMGQFVAFYLFNVNSNTAKISVENILPYVEPKYYGEVKKMLYEQVQYIIDNDISRVFYPSAINVDNKGVIKVIGILKDIIGSKVVSSRQVELDVRYKIKQGRFWITSIVVKEKK